MNCFQITNKWHCLIWYLLYSFVRVALATRATYNRLSPVIFQYRKADLSDKLKSGKSLDLRGFYHSYFMPRISWFSLYLPIIILLYYFLQCIQISRLLASVVLCIFCLSVPFQFVLFPRRISHTKIICSKNPPFYKETAHVPQ